MNITVVRLVIIATSTGFVVMCKNTHGSRRVFLNARVNSTFLGRDSLPLVLITVAIATPRGSLNVRHMCKYLCILFLFSNYWTE